MPSTAAAPAVRPSAIITDADLARARAALGAVGAAVDDPALRRLLAADRNARPALRAEEAAELIADFAGAANPYGMGQLYLRGRVGRRDLEGDIARALAAVAPGRPLASPFYAIALADGAVVLRDALPPGLSEDDPVA